MHGTCKKHLNSQSPFLSLWRSGTEYFLLWKRRVLFAWLVWARFSGRKRLHRILYVKRSFCHPKEQKPPAAEGGNRYDGWNMQVVCQQTRSTCLQFIDCSLFSQILNTFFAVQWTQNAIPALLSSSYCNISIFRVSQVIQAAKDKIKARKIIQI